jgi:hypothetical protein
VRPNSIEVCYSWCFDIPHHFRWCSSSIDYSTDITVSVSVSLILPYGYFKAECLGELWDDTAFSHFRINDGQQQVDLKHTSILIQQYYFNIWNVRDQKSNSHRRRWKKSDKLMLFDNWQLSVAISETVTGRQPLLLFWIFLLCVLWIIWNSQSGSVNYLEFTERFCELSWNSQSGSVNCRGIHRTKKKWHFTIIIRLK